MGDEHQLADLGWVSMLPTEVQRVLYWEDKLQTGAVVVMFNLLFYLFLFGGYTVPQLIVSTLWVSLLARFAFVNGIRVATIFNPDLSSISDSISRKSKIEAAPYSEESFQPLAKMMNGVSKFWAELSCCKDTFFVMQVLVGLQLAGYAASWFSLSSLVYILVTCLFTIPRVMKNHEKEYMKYYNAFSTAATGAMGNVMAQIPSASKIKAAKRGTKTD